MIKFISPEGKGVMLNGHDANIAIRGGEDYQLAPNQKVEGVALDGDRALVILTLVKRGLMSFTDEAKNCT